ncbi:hypothetical protein D9M68_835210 [compost metagenome]
MSVGAALRHCVVGSTAAAAGCPWVSGLDFRLPQALSTEVSVMAHRVAWIFNIYPSFVSAIIEKNSVIQCEHGSSSARGTRCDRIDRVARSSDPQGRRGLRR